MLFAKVVTVEKSVDDNKRLLGFVSNEKCSNIVSLSEKYYLGQSMRFQLYAGNKLGATRAK